MPGLFVHTSNRLETLADGLAAVLRQPLRAPLQPEIVVVLNQGMGRWLKLELAGRLGLWANCEFPFPSHFAHQVFQALLPEPPAASLFCREVLVWKLMALLPRLAGQSGFEEVRHYLEVPAPTAPAGSPGAAADPRKLHQLATRLAHLFEQYPVHRPALVLGWETGEDPQWQAVLWRELVAAFGSRHPAALLRQLSEVRATEADAPVPAPDPYVAVPRPVLPERVAVFGVSTLPPFQLELLARLGTRLEVHVFRLEPSQELWSHVRSERQQQRLLARAGQPLAAAAAFHLETGNRLLASLGQAGRSFQELLLDSGDWQDDAQFHPPGTDSLLHAIQDDLLHLRDRGRAPADFGFRIPEADLEDGPQAAAGAVLPIGAEDRSLQVHSCHSPLREIEVLADHLLAWFQQDPTLTPRDILVLTPDIEAYAPFLQAVFDAPEDEGRRIPFSLADRAARQEHGVGETFLRLLRLSGSRCTAPEVLAPLETPAVRARFQIGEPELELLRGWVRKTHIRWGRDAAHQQALGLPAHPENTWRHGLDRLLLGYAMDGREPALFAGILPSPDIEGAATETLGCFAAYVERLFAAVDDLPKPRSLSSWEETLGGLLTDFFSDHDDWQGEIAAVRFALRQLRTRAGQAGFTEAVPLAVVLETLEGELQEERYGSGFLTGGVTCGALKPMRSIPFRVICLVGLNDGAFPRSDPKLAFDLMAQHPQPGDRSTRDDDRYLFLETLLSARDRLYLSYVGQSLRDNSAVPPSVVVSDLLDYVKQGFVAAPPHTAQPQAADGPSLVDRLVVKHRLQAFSPAYFDARDPRLFSYSTENCAASIRAQSARSAPAPFVGAPLSEPEPEFRALDLDQLAGFFRNPAKFLLQRRLGLRLPLEEEPLEDREPFAVEGLDRFLLQAELVELRLAGADVRAQCDVLRAAGRLPPGESGTLWFTGQCDIAEEFAAKVAPCLAGRRAEPVSLDLTLGEFRLTGQLTTLTQDGLLDYRCVKQPGGADLLRLWLGLLAAHAAGIEPVVARGLFVTREETVQLQPPDHPRELLASLLETYWSGLRQPLKFFPKTSWAFAEQEYRLSQPGNRAKKDPLLSARGMWEGDAYRDLTGEGDDPWFALCFGQGDPLDDEFKARARTVFGPLLSRRVAAGSAEPGASA